MELKRYVLLENNLIVDVSRGSLYANGHVGKYILKDNIVYSQYNDGDTLYVTYEIKKTSDNILDLAEVGECVECLYHRESTTGENWIEIPIYYITGISETHFHLPVFSIEKTDKNIIALWKRNGNTMTRYKVEK